MAFWMVIFKMEDGTQRDSLVEHYMSHINSMIRKMHAGRLHEALESTQPQATCGENCHPELQEELQLVMLTCMLNNTDGPEHLARSDVKDVVSRLMALGSLQSNQSYHIEGIFDSIVRAYYPNNVKIFFDTLTLHIHEDTHWQKLLKNVHSAMERRLYGLLQGMESSRSKEELRELQKTFSDLIQAMAIPLCDDSVPAMLYPPTTLYTCYKNDHHPLFTTAVNLKLALEALLLYDAGAVGNKELGLLAEDPDVQKMLQSEDKSVLAVFLRKVLNKPRSLESLATMQVSRLLGCHAPGDCDKEQTARGLGLLDYHVERVLLRRQCGRYREALKQADKQADDEDKAGASQ